MAVKLADDQSGDVVVRLYEAHGGRARARLSTSFELASVQETDLLERRLTDRELEDGAVEGEGEGEGGAGNGNGAVELALRPFQVLTLRLKRSA